MNELLFGLSVAAVGILVVFAGLVLLIYCIKLITYISNSLEKKNAEPAPNATPAPAPRISVPAPAQAALGIAPETIAAITAAIAAVWEGESGFIVRRVRRIHNAAAWNVAGREDQVYSRM